MNVKVMRKRMLDWERRHMPTLGKPINLRKFATMGVLVGTLLTGVGCDKTQYYRLTKGYKGKDVVYEVLRANIHGKGNAFTEIPYAPAERTIYAKVEKGIIDSAITWVIRIPYVEREDSSGNKGYVRMPPEMIRVYKLTSPDVVKRLSLSSSSRKPKRRVRRRH